MSACRHPAEEDLLQLVLERAPSLAELRACPVCAPAIGELEALVGDLRGALAPELAGTLEPADAGLAERVLARTTREDLGWRGDLRLVLGFAGQRLRSSRLMRFVAASLLVHLIVLPVLAYLAWRGPQPERAIFITTEPRRDQAPPVVPMEPERDVQLTEPAPPGLLVPVRGEPARAPRPSARQAEAAREAERQHLLSLRGEAPPVGETAPEDTLERLLWMRSRRLNDQLVDPWLEGAQPPPGSTTVELALWAENLIDHYVLRHRTPLALPGTLERLAREEAAGDAAERLALHALVRAARLGVLPSDLGPADLDRRLGALGPDAGAAFDEPLGGAWASALEAAVGQRELARAWAAALRR
jgi:hypothetical protein